MVARGVAWSCWRRRPGRAALPPGADATSSAPTCWPGSRASADVALLGLRRDRRARLQLPGRRPVQRPGRRSSASTPGCGSGGAATDAWRVDRLLARRRDRPDPRRRPAPPSRLRGRAAPTAQRDPEIRLPRTADLRARRPWPRGSLGRRRRRRGLPGCRPGGSPASTRPGLRLDPRLARHEHRPRRPVGRPRHRRAAARSRSTPTASSRRRLHLDVPRLLGRRPPTPTAPRSAAPPGPSVDASTTCSTSPTPPTSTPPCRRRASARRPGRASPTRTRRRRGLRHGRHPAHRHPAARPGGRSAARRQLAATARVASVAPATAVVLPRRAAGRAADRADDDGRLAGRRHRHRRATARRRRPCDVLRSGTVYSGRATLGDPHRAA